MLSFPLKNLVLSPFPVTNYCKYHQISPKNVFFRTRDTSRILSAFLSFLWSPITRQKGNFNAHTFIQASSSDYIQEEEEEAYQVLSAVRSNYNDIIIVDTPKARILLLDSTHNVHSILNKDRKWTGSYWDEFASLPAIIPKGPVAIFGLGGGTAAHLMLDLWPSLELEGWEIDPILIDKARQHFELSDLEKHTTAGGILHINIGDALSSSGSDSERYAGIVVDLFCEGKVLQQLQKVATWLELSAKLMPNGRFMVNCGGIPEKSDYADGMSHPKSADSTWAENPIIGALTEAFPGQVSWKRMPEIQGANYLALTGPLPDLTLWSTKVPDPLSENVRQWKPCGPIS